MTIETKVSKMPKFKLIWFYISVISAVIPILLRLALAANNSPYFDIKDVQYASIAICISNLNLLAHRDSLQINHLIAILAFSFFVLIFASAMLGSTISDECYSIKKSYTNFISLKDVLGIGFILLAIYVSYVSNKLVVNSLNLSRITNNNDKDE